MSILVNDSGGVGLAPRGKFHIAPGMREAALCGAKPSAGYWPTHVGDRAEFERLLSERICKRCKRADA